MIKKYVTLRVNNITDEDLIIETTGYNINYQYKNSDLISYCNSFAPKDGNPTQSPSFKKTLKEYHWPSSKIKTLS